MAQRGDVQSNPDSPVPIGIMGIQGRNGSDDSFVVRNDQCLEAMNIDWFGSSLGRRRGGSTDVSLATGGTVFASGVVAGARHVPGADQTAAECWTLDGARNFHRLAGSAIWASPTVLDACSATPQETNFLSFNGKLFISYKSAHNRLHVWDGTSVRRVGLDLPAVVTGFALAGGAVTDTRKYRIAWTVQVAGVTVRRSNLSVASASQALAANQITVTRTTAPGEGETHWELYGASTSSTFGDYRLVATTVIATTTAVDNAGLTGTVAPADGANTPPPSFKYMVADDARVIGTGCYEVAANAENAAAPSDHRVWYTSILGASDVGDDERISVTGTINNYADLEEAPTGLTQPMQVVNTSATSLERGSFYVFSYESQWKFIATGDSDSPYIKFRITGGGGCVHHKSIITAIDANGNPAIYWWSPNGPMRIAADGQQYLGNDLADFLGTVNLDATVPCHSVYYPALKQVWYYVATGTSAYPDKRVVFDTRLGRVTDTAGVRMGWSVADGESAKAYCSLMFSETIGATMGRKLMPHVGYTGATKLWRCDTSAETDAGTPFQAYLDLKSYAPWGLGRKGGLADAPMLVAEPSAGVSIRLTIYRNEGAYFNDSDVSLTDQSDSGDADKVFPIFEGAKLADSFSFRCRVGDAQAIAASWTIHGLIVPVIYQGDH